jgi:SAM-dependent methyltransferase
MNESGRSHDPAGAGELDRLDATYRERDARMPPGDWRRNVYHPRHPVGRLFHAHNRHELVRVLNAADLELRGLRVLDVGCGHGGWLRMLQDLGADPAALHGLELGADRVRTAARGNPAMHWARGDAGALPYPAGGFDLTLQVLLFSSVLDPGLHQRAGAELVRVTRPGGHILWLDLRRDTPGRLTGFPRPAVRALLPGTRPVYWRRVHPHLFRSLGPRAPGLARVLAALRLGPFEAWLGLLRREAS